MIQQPMTTFKCNSLVDLDAIAKNIIHLSGSERIFILKGQMGSGKTTLVQSLCAALNVEDDVTSPTFTILNEYRDDKGEAVYHFDLYRIKNINELYDFGYEVYFYSGKYCFIECFISTQDVLRNISGCPRHIS